MNRFRVPAVKAALLATTLAASPADASRRVPVSIGMLAAFQAAGAQNFCFAYAYDRNGNRVSKTNLTWGSGTWGSSVYGCFKWRAP